MKMTKFRLTLALALLCCGSASAQPTGKAISEPAPALEWYFPTLDGSFDSSVPTPSQALGFEIGERFAEWDDVLRYMQTLSEVSPRVSLKTFGRTFENRPFIQVCITTPENQARLEEIRQSHLAISELGSAPIAGQPIVVDVMASIHGNEASGVNAVLPMAYYFAASEDPSVLELLKNSILVFTPGLNPDGINRFGHWVNNNSSFNHWLDGDAREYAETGPSSRSNHYWMDCNRDWLTAQFPEGRNCVEMYRYWMPNVVLDLHEQGSYKNGLYYFSPGDPKRTYEYVPQRNQDLTLAISDRTDCALAAIGTPRFSRRGYDDFFIGKGAAYCDILGGVGILHEQTSTRGHLKSFGTYGPHTFASTVRNQTLASFAVIRGAYELRDSLLSFQHDFYASMNDLPEGGYVFNARGNKGLAYEFLKNLRLHEIRVWEVEGKPGTYALPFRQKSYYMERCIFDDITSYTDSVFYDISTWSPARAFNLEYSSVQELPALGFEVVEPALGPGTVDCEGVAYAFEGTEYYAPYIVSALQQKGIPVKVSTEGFAYRNGKSVRHFPAGTFVVEDSEGVSDHLSSLAAECGVSVSGLIQSKKFALSSLVLQEVRTPFCGVVYTSSASVTGSVWYMLDRRFAIPHSLLNFDRFSVKAFEIEKYNSLVFCGSVPSKKEAPLAYERIGKWLSDGGTLILQGSAHYMADELEIPGAIKATTGTGVDGIVLSATMQPGSPLLWGYSQDELALFKGKATTWEAPEGSDVVLSWSSEPYLSGCVSAQNLSRIAGTPALVTVPYGKGTVVFIEEDLTYRSYWLGANHILTNAIFFGNML